MNITMLHDLDTGFFSRTLKQPLIDLGHQVTVIQTTQTYLEEDTSHVDHLLSNYTPEMSKEIQQCFKETDFFILRSVTDNTLRTLNPPCHHKNTIYKVHGSEIRENLIPYTLDFYRTRTPILVCGPRDPSLIDKYRQPVFTYIERPCDFASFPRKQPSHTPFALHTPTNMQRKGTQRLLDTFTEEGKIELLILSGVSRQECLKHKAQASFFIDHLGSYPHGPYGMNSIEAMYYSIPVWSNTRHIDLAIEPTLPNLVRPFNITTIAEEIHSYEADKKQLRLARNYALDTHDKHKIAQQYVDLAQWVIEQ